MARHAEGEIGGIRGKVGTMVVSEWNGIPVVKRSPRFSSNRKFTEEQQIQHAKFKLASRFFRTFNDFFKLTFDQVKGQSGRNLAFQQLITNAITGDYPNFAVNYSKVLVAKGKLKPAVTPSAVGEAGLVRFHWSNVELPGQSDPFDLAILVVYCPEIDYLYYNLMGPNRSAGTCALDVPFFAGKEVHTWISFRSRNGRYKADSIYTGAVDV